VNWISKTNARVSFSRLVRLHSNCKTAPWHLRFFKQPQCSGAGGLDCVHSATYVSAHEVHRLWFWSLAGRWRFEVGWKRQWWTEWSFSLEKHTQDVVTKTPVASVCSQLKLTFQQKFCWNVECFIEAFLSHAIPASIRVKALSDYRIIFNKHFDALNVSFTYLCISTWVKHVTVCLGKGFSFAQACDLVSKNSS